MMTTLNNIVFVDAEKEEQGTLYFNRSFLPQQQNTNATIDGDGLIAFPGLVDPHVHFRTPGLEHKETFQTGGESALAGGITTVFDMPNTIPPVFDTDTLNKKRAIINHISPIHFGLFICGNEHNIEELKNAKNIAGIKLFLNDTTGHLLLNNRDVWKAIFSLGRQVTLHAEGDTFLEAISIWEELNYPCRIHLAHMTLKKEVDQIMRLKHNAITQKLISCEVCPHHLFFSDGDVAINPFLRMKPELATEEDRLSLWKAIEEGIIDCFATDHAPHLIEEKKNTPPAFGVPGVETLLPLLFTVWVQKKWSLKKLAAMTSYNALKIYGVQNLKGLFQEGYDADFTVIDANTPFTLQGKNLHSKCGWTPFENFAVYGKVKATFLQGQQLYDGINFHPNTISNKEISFIA